MTEHAFPLRSVNVARLTVDATRLDADGIAAGTENWSVEDASLEDLRRAFAEDGIVGIAITRREGRMWACVTEHDVIQTGFCERSGRLTYRPTARPAREQALQLLERFLTHADRDPRVAWRWAVTPRLPGQPLFTLRDTIEIAVLASILVAFFVWLSL